MVLGPDKPVHILPTFENRGKETFYIEAKEFPSASFSGLVSFSVSLIEKAHDQVCYQVRVPGLGRGRATVLRQDTEECLALGTAGVS